LLEGLLLEELPNISFNGFNSSVLSTNEPIKLLSLRVEREDENNLSIFYTLTFYFILKINNN
jgi:hypothetical protein